MLVVKKIETAHMSDQEKTQASREVELHTDLRHQHIVQYISHFVEDATLHIVMQYVKQRKRSMRACLFGECRGARCGACGACGVACAPCGVVSWHWQRAYTGSVCGACGIASACALVSHRTALPVYPSCTRVYPPSYNTTNQQTNPYLSPPPLSPRSREGTARVGTSLLR